MTKIAALLGLLATPLAALPAATSAEAPPLLTLDEAVALASSTPGAGSRRLGAADARLAAAAAAAEEARSYRLPRIELQGGFERTNHPVLVFSHLLAQESFGAENFEIDRLNRPDPLSDWSLRLSLEQPLWTGGRLAHREESARRLHEGASAERERTRQQVVLQVTESYATAVLARHRLGVAREALETAEAHVRLIADLWQGGLVVESDLLLAQVRESELREVLIRAESGVEISRAAVNLALGRDQATPFSLPETLELRDDPELGLDALIERAHERRPDLVSAHRRRGAAQSRVAASRAGNRPQVDLRAAYEAHTEDWIDDVVGGDNWTIGVGLRVPLFEGFRTRAQVRRARAQEREAAELDELLAQSIALEVRRGFHDLRAARQRLEQAAKAASLARRSLTIVEDRYKEGLTTSPELLDAETALTEARLREVEARRDVILAGAGLDLATGDL